MKRWFNKKYKDSRDPASKIIFGNFYELVTWILKLNNDNTEKKKHFILLLDDFSLFPQYFVLTTSSDVIQNNISNTTIILGADLLENQRENDRRWKWRISASGSLCRRRYFCHHRQVCASYYPKTQPCLRRSVRLSSFRSKIKWN